MIWAGRHSSKTEGIKLVFMVQTGLKNINHVPWYVYLFFIRYICSYFKYIIKQVNIGVDNNENNLLIFFYSLKIH